MDKRIGIALLATLLAGTSLRAAPAVETLRAVSLLPKAEAARRIPVRLTGVMTLVATWGRLAFILADTNAPNSTALYIEGSDTGRPILQMEGFQKPRVGMIVEVTGETDPGAFAPMVKARRARLLGSMPLPEPPLVRLRDLDFGCRDNQRVRIRGVVRRIRGVSPDGSFAALELATPDGSFIAHVNRARPFNWPGLVDAEVTLSGIAMTFFNQRSEFIGVQLELAGNDALAIDLPAPADPFAIPEAPLNSILPYSPVPQDCHRRKVRGTVTLYKPGRYLYLQDGDLALRVNTQLTAPLRIGDTVEAAGYPGINEYFGELNDSLFRAVGRAARMPAAIPLTANDLLTMHTFPSGQQVNYDSRLITLRGRAFKLDAPERGERRLYLDVDGRTILATLDSPIPFSLRSALRDLPLVTVSGICQITLESGLPSGRVLAVRDVRILLRDAADIAVIPDLPWTARRHARFLQQAGVALLILFALVIIALLAKVARNHRLRLRTEAVQEERKRMAGDLHDTIEQHLTGAMMLLRTSIAMTPDASPRVKEAVNMASEILINAKREVRNTVWNLRSDLLHQQTLAQALGDMASQLSAGGRVSVRCDLESLPKDLPAPQIINLLFLAQEAVTNAIKHGRARAIAILAAREKEAFTLTVENDGEPFDPAAAQGPETGHFGLAGMRDRARRIGATLAFESAPSGTRVLIRVPLYKE